MVYTRTGAIVESAEWADTDHTLVNLIAKYPDEKTSCARGGLPVDMLRADNGLTEILAFIK